MINCSTTASTTSTLIDHIYSINAKFVIHRPVAERFYWIFVQSLWHLCAGTLSKSHLQKRTNHEFIFGKTRAKSILLGTQKRLKKISISILDMVQCLLDNTIQSHTSWLLRSVNLPEELIALQVIKKINARLRYSYRKNWFLS